MFYLHVYKTLKNGNLSLNARVSPNTKMLNVAGSLQRYIREAQQEGST